MQKIKACIFDLDGTILYTLESIARAGNLMLETLGFPPQPVPDYRYYCGDGSDNLVRRCLTTVGGLTEENFRRGAELNRIFLKENALYGLRPYDGLEETLAKLKQSGVRLAVFTNKPDNAAQEAVRSFYGDTFDLVRGQMSGVPIKPDPSGALKIIREFGISPEECAYFGDSCTDMKTGKAAGFYTAGVLWGYRSREELLENGADLLVEQPQDILHIPGIPGCV